MTRRHRRKSLAQLSSWLLPDQLAFRHCGHLLVYTPGLELTEFGFNFAEHFSDLFVIQHVPLHGETVSSSFAHLRKRVYRGGLVFIIVDSYIDTVFGQFESDPSTDATGASCDERVFSLQ